VFVLATEIKAMSVVVTSATTIYFVFPNLIYKAKKKILLWTKGILDDRLKKIRRLAWYGEAAFLSRKAFGKESGGFLKKAP